MGSTSSPPNIRVPISSLSNFGTLKTLATTRL
jgi:hypothetical protein